MVLILKLEYRFNLEIVSNDIKKILHSIKYLFFALHKVYVAFLTIISLIILLNLLFKKCKYIKTKFI